MSDDKDILYIISENDRILENLRMIDPEMKESKIKMLHEKKLANK